VVCLRQSESRRSQQLREYGFIFNERFAIAWKQRPDVITTPNGTRADWGVATESLVNVAKKIVSRFDRIRPLVR